MRGNIFAEGVLRGLRAYEKHMAPYRERLRKAIVTGKGEEAARVAFWSANDRYLARRAKK